MDERDKKICRGLVKALLKQDEDEWLYFQKLAKISGIALTNISIQGDFTKTGKAVIENHSVTVPIKGGKINVSA